jgi:regulator of RNase E activity RraA
MMNGVDTLAAEFCKLDTPCVSDALDRLGIAGGLPRLKPVLVGSGKVICGPAFTVRYIPVGVEKKTVGDFLESVPKGAVVVVDNGGRDYCTVWGDIMSRYAAMNGIAGTVIDGVCRDVKVIRELEYPMYSKGCYMVTGKDRVQMDATAIPVSICGLQVRPDDLMFCDDNGVLRIPYERASEVLDIAISIEETESKILAALKEGISLVEARKNMGYHQLQTKR